MKVVHLVESLKDSRTLFGNSVIFVKQKTKIRPTAYINPARRSNPTDEVCVKIDNKCYEILTKPQGKLTGVVDSEIGWLGVCIGEDKPKEPIKIKPKALLASASVLVALSVLFVGTKIVNTSHSPEENKPEETQVVQQIEEKPEEVPEEKPHKVGANVKDLPFTEDESTVEVVTEDALDKKDDSEYAKRQLLFLAEAPVPINDEYDIEIMSNPVSVRNPIYYIRNSKSFPIQVKMIDTDENVCVWFTTIESGNYGYFDAYKRLKNGLNHLEITLESSRDLDNDGENDKYTYTMGVFVK